MPPELTLLAETLRRADGTSRLRPRNAHAAATLSGAGMARYVDRALVASDPATTTGQAFTGTWRFGCGNLTGWTPAPSNSLCTGTLAFGAGYTTALTAAQVREDCLAGRP